MSHEGAFPCPTDQLNKLFSPLCLQNYVSYAQYKREEVNTPFLLGYRNMHGHEILLKKIN